VQAQTEALSNSALDIEREGEKMKIRYRVAVVAATGALAVVPLSAANAAGNSAAGNKQAATVAKGAVSARAGVNGPVIASNSGDHCYLNFPSTVRVTSWNQTVRARLSGCTPGGALPWWTAANWGYSASFASSYYDSVDVGYGSLGTYTWYPFLPLGMIQNYPKTTFRDGSSSSVSTSRSGSYVSVKGTASRYAQSYFEWIRWARAYGHFQYYSSSRGWVTFKAATLNASGQYSSRIHSPSARSYRFWVSGTSQIWGSTSSSSRR
jgi:hypothetical protein